VAGATQGLIRERLPARIRTWWCVFAHSHRAESRAPVGPETIGFAYPKARRGAALETGLAREVFPAACPFAGKDALDPDFLPGTD